MSLLGYGGPDESLIPGPEGRGLVVLQLGRVEIVVIIGVEGQVGQDAVETDDKLHPSGGVGSPVAGLGGLHGLGDLEELLVVDQVGVVGAESSGIIVVPGGIGGGKAAAAVDHVVIDLAGAVEGGAEGRGVTEGLVDLKAQAGGVGGEEGGQHLADGVAVGGEPLDMERHEAAIVQLFVANLIGALNEVLAVLVQGPAAANQFFLGFVEVEGVFGQGLVELGLVFGVGPLGVADTAVHQDAVAAGVLTDELLTVEGVGDGATNLLKLGGALRAVEEDLAIAVTGIVGVLELAGVDQIEAGGNLGAAGHAGVEVDGAGAQLFDSGGILNELDDQSLDHGLRAVVIAGVLVVGLEDGLVGAGVVAYELIGAGGDGGSVTVALRTVVKGGLQEVETPGPFEDGTVRSVLHVAAGGQNVHGVGGDKGIGKLEPEGEVRGTLAVGGGDGNGELIVAQEVETLEGLDGALVVLHEAEIVLVAVSGIVLQRGQLGRGAQQHGEDIVLRGDLGAVVVCKTLVDLNLICLRAVGVLGLLEIFDNNGVNDELVLLGVGDGAVAIDEILDALVGSQVGPALKHIGVQGVGTDNELTRGLGLGGLGGLDALGRGGGLLIHSLAAGGQQAEQHGQGQRQCK